MGQMGKLKNTVTLMPSIIQFGKGARIVTISRGRNDKHGTDTTLLLINLI